MALKSDKDGFLIGEGEGIRFRSLADAYGVLKGIKSDTKAIVSMLKGARVRQSIPRVSSRAPEVVASPGRRPAVAAAAAPARAESSRSGRSAPRGVAAAPATPQRDSRGRFIASGKAKPGKGGKGGEQGDQDDKESSSGRRGLFRRVAEAMKVGAKEAAVAGTNGTEQVDPSLMAAKEIKDAVAPVAGVIGKVGGALFGSGDQEEKRQAKINAKEQERRNLPWYKRFHKLLAKNQVVAAGGAQSGGGMLAGLGRMLLPLILPLLAVVGAGVAGTFIGKWINDKFGTKIQDMIAGASELASSTWGAIKEKWTAVTDSVSSAFTAAGEKWDSITTRLGETIDALKGALGGAVDKVKSKFSDKLSAAKSLFTGSNSANRKRLEAAADRAGITDTKERAAFMAQNHHESSGFRRLEESFAYSPDRLMEVSANARAQGRDAAVRAVRAGPKAVAELMYGGRMGNAQSGDAYKYRGRGFIHLTGKNQYAEAGKALGIDLVNNPDLASDPDIAARISTWYWGKSGAGASARAGNVAATTRAVNGGYNGIAQRGHLTAAYAATQAPASSGAAPSADRFRVPKIEVPPQRLNSQKAEKPAVNVKIQAPLTQNVGDRGIANVATGGMGGKGDSM